MDVVLFTESLGFSGVKLIREYGERAAKLKYRKFDPKAVRAALGRSTKHEENIFVFVLSKDKVVRVNTKTQYIWLGNGKSVVKYFLSYKPQQAGKGAK